MKTNFKINQFTKPEYLVCGTVRFFAEVIHFHYFTVMDIPLKPKGNILSAWIFNSDPARTPIVVLLDAALALALFVLLKPLNRSIVIFGMIILLLRTLTHRLRRLIRLFWSGCCGEAVRLKTVIDRIYPTQQVDDANSYVDNGPKKGNIVVQYTS